MTEGKEVWRMDKEYAWHGGAWVWTSLLVLLINLVLSNHKPPHLRLYDLQTGGGMFSPVLLGAYGAAILVTKKRAEWAAACQEI